MGILQKVEEWFSTTHPANTHIANFPKIKFNGNILFKKYCSRQMAQMHSRATQTLFNTHLPPTSSIKHSQKIKLKFN
jgi:hypothetical protein